MLRLGTHQLLATRIGPHAAVATSVALAREVAGGGAAGFANAVLRRVATRDLDSWIAVVAPDRAADPVGYLAVKTSHPGWIVAAVSESLGEEPVTGLPLTEAALAANGIRPRVTLCAVPGLATPADLVARGSQAARWSPFGAYLDGGDPAGIPEVRQGRAAVQDEASQLAALALARADTGTASPAEPGPGGPDGDRRWLDLCAGPGGKARLLAGLAAGRGARLLAADVREHRARLVRAATARGQRRHGGRGGRHQARLAARLVRPGDRRRPLLRARGPAAPPGRTLAQDAGRRGGARRAAALAARAPRSTPPGPAG